MRCILVPVADRPECGVALQSAFQIADRLPCNVVGYHVRPHDRESPRAVRSVPFLQRDFGDWQDFLNDRNVPLDSEAARAFFLERVREYGFQSVPTPRYRDGGGLALWREMKGTPGKVMSIIGPLADLVVLSRPDKLTSVRSRSFLLSAVLLSGRPVLILPSRRVPDIGTRILIAWNRSPEAAAAVLAARPLLERAEAVHIVCCGKLDRTGPSARHLQQHLRFSNISAKVVRLKEADEQAAIYNYYRKTDSNLLVMGAYSRHRWRETVFGGMTHHFMNRAAIPVLMLHQ